jgi:hypothetical protein
VKLKKFRRPERVLPYAPELVAAARRARKQQSAFSSMPVWFSS